MKKKFIERGLVFLIVFIVFLISGYLYKEGRITFLPQKNKGVNVQNMVAGIPYVNKEYKLSYENSLAEDIAEIANFEDTENWKGDGEFDFSSMADGESSLFLSSKNNYKAVATLKLKNDIYLDNYKNAKILINLKNDNANIENLVIKFTNNERGSIHYPIRQLNQGWNLILMELDKFIESSELSKGKDNGFGQINEVSIELIARPKSTVSINVDSLWLEKNEDYSSKWNFRDYNYLIVKKDREKTLPYFLELEEGVATLKEIGSVKDFSFIVKFKPLTQGFFGLFLRGDCNTRVGYYFTVDGVGTNSWQINKLEYVDETKKSVELAKGEINNFKMEKDKEYYLKGELKENNLNFFISLDGAQYTRLGGVNDSSFISGGVGVFTHGASFTVDEIAFFQ